MKEACLRAQRPLADERRAKARRMMAPYAAAASSEHALSTRYDRILHNAHQVELHGQSMATIPAAHITFTRSASNGRG
jgi:hypothetical protein